MPNPYVREIGRLEDIDGRLVPVGVDHDAVTVGIYRLGREQWNEFAKFSSIAVAHAKRYEDQREETDDA